MVVAADDHDRAIGWLHAELRGGLTTALSVHVAGLVVDEAHRSAGIGQSLLAAGEAWARERGGTHHAVFAPDA